MPSVIRYSTVTNTTGAVLTTALVADGKEYALKAVTRTFAAADIGNAVGQTQNATGALAAQFQGSVIKDVLEFQLFRANSPIGSAQNIDYILSPDLKSIYAHDGGAIDIQAGDSLRMLLVTGNN
jgi:hypothetical protein